LKYLFDAFSFVKALKLCKPEVLVDSFTQWLTVYEIMNALWREARLLKFAPTEKLLQLVDVVIDVVKYMEILSVSNLEREILKMSIELDLVAYDASYIVLAQRHGLTLVTENKKLMNKAKNYINVISLDTLLNRHPS
jgi:predicted nucleic acid-binding protein